VFALAKPFVRQSRRNRLSTELPFRVVIEFYDRGGDPAARSWAGQKKSSRCILRPKKKRSSKSF